jgi:hypothetical protein
LGECWPPPFEAPVGWVWLAGAKGKIMSVHWVEARFSYQEAGVAIDEHGAKVSEWLNSLEEEYIILDFKMTVAENGNIFCLAKVDARDWSP